MSVVDKIASLAVTPEKEEARDRLLEAERRLNDSGNTESHSGARVEKLRALVDLDWFAAAAKFANADATNDEFVILAYSLYRLGKVDELREAVNRHGGSSAPIGARLSLAQAEYKAGHLEEARKLFESCLESVSREDAADIIVNLGAIDALNGIDGTTSESPTVASFDEAFNRCCALLVRGKAEEALELLQQAREVAEEEDDRQAAVVQAAYAHLLSGSREQASELLETVLASSPLTQLPLSLRIVVANNRLAATYEGGDLTAAHKALISYDDFAQSGIELNSNQRQVVERNQLKLLSRVGISRALRRAANHLAAFPTDAEPLAVAYHHTKPLKKIRKLAHSGDIAARVCLAARDNKEWQYAGAQLQNGDIGQVVTAAKSAVQGGASKDILDKYFTSLRVRELVDAGKGLTAAPTEITSGLLDKIAARTSSVDAESLNFAVPQSAHIHTSIKPVGHKKRTGKRKLPASFDPERTPNPERWLAKQDRSDYKPKKKKTSQATQGAAIVSDESPAPSTSQVVGAKTKKKTKKKGKK